MSFSVLLLGVTETIGPKVAKELSLQKHLFKRLAFLTPPADAGPGKEARYAAIDLEHLVGSASDPESYRGFDIVVSTVADDACDAQPEHIDAAFAGGVKHFYPAEYGPDLTHPLVRDEPYFVEKISTRKHLEARVQTDASLGYTYVMTGIFAKLLLDFNILGLNRDKNTANYFGSPDAKVSTTCSSDVARLIVTSLLPNHLTSLGARRHIRFAGSTLQASSIFDAVAYVLRQPISVTYEVAATPAATSSSLSADFPSSQSPKRTEKSQQQLSPNKEKEREKEPREGESHSHHATTDLSQKMTSLRRAVGFGGFEIRPGLQQEQEHGQEQEGGHDGDGDREEDYYSLLKPRGWAEAVKEYFDEQGR